MHKSNSVSKSLSIKTPFIQALEGKKKGRGVINPSTLILPLHCLNEKSYSRENYIIKN